MLVNLNHPPKSAMPYRDKTLLIRSDPPGLVHLKPLEASRGSYLHFWLNCTKKQV